MTLIAALESQEGLVLAADSRGTIGDPRGLTAINDVQRKLFKLTASTGILISGASELAVRVLDKLKDHLDKQITANLVNPEHVDSVLDAAVQIMKGEYTASFGGPRPWIAPSQLVDQRPAIIFVLAGYKQPGGGNARESRIYLLNSAVDFAPQLCPTGFMLAGIPQYAIYLLHRLYDRKMALKSLQALAAYLISETASQDPKVGGPIRMATITPDAGFAELDDCTVNALIQANEEQSRRLKEFFFKGGAV